MRRESKIFVACVAGSFLLTAAAFQWREYTYERDASLNTKSADFRPVMVRVEERTKEEVGAVNEAVFDATEEEVYEQEASEEGRGEAAGPGIEGDAEEPGTEPETTPETVEDEADDWCEGTQGPDRDAVLPEPCPLYSVNGSVLDPELQEYLYKRLSERGISHWMPIALAQAYQECSFDIYQVTNGLDCGLFQYRNLYWDEWCDRAGVAHSDIFDPYRQIDVYTTMVAKWIQDGCTESVVISNHNSGGWSYEIVPGYLHEVTRWFDYVTRIN